jgi:hypothetical protein
MLMCRCRADGALRRVARADLMRAIAWPLPPLIFSFRASPLRHAATSLSFARLFSMLAADYAFSPLIFDFAFLICHAC